MNLSMEDQKRLLEAAFSAGLIWGSLRAGLRLYKDRQARQGREISKLRRYKEWSHRAISVLVSFHELNHPGQHGVEPWQEPEDQSNGG